mgnify:CR=1 FL=1
MSTGSHPRSPARILARKAKGFLNSGAFRILEAAAFSSWRARVIVVFGMKRSGNHVFINWLLAQHPGPVVFYNHVHPQEIPYHRWKREWRVNDPLKPPAIIFSYEDRDFDETFAGPLQDFLSAHAGRIAEFRTCVVMRDPRNFFASRFKKWSEEYHDGDRTRRLIDMYKLYARAFEGGGALARHGPVTCVRYNRLITSAEYRRELSAALGIRQGDRGLDEVPHYGHGSSFDGVALRNRAADMDVFGRWRAYAEDPVFRRIMSDPEIAALDRALS